jgi:hypothetical protein
MIEIHKSDNLLAKGFFNFEYSKERLLAADRADIARVKAIGFYFQDDDVEATEFKHFFKKFNRALLQEHEVYLVLAEAYPKKKNRVRSKRLMFYQEREGLGEANLLEAEIEFIGGQTLLIGAARLTEDNLDYALSRLINDFFIFGYAVGKGSPGLGHAALAQIIQSCSNSAQKYEPNYLKLSNLLLPVGQLLFRIALDGKSKQSLEAYGLDNAMERLERLVEGELGGYYLRRRG